jgi:hypothetical protein
MYQIFYEDKIQYDFLIHRPFLSLLKELFLEAKPFLGAFYEVASSPLLSALSSQK